MKKLCKQRDFLWLKSYLLCSLIPLFFSLAPLFAQTTPRTPVTVTSVNTQITLPADGMKIQDSLGELRSLVNLGSKWKLIPRTEALRLFKELDNVWIQKTVFFRQNGKNELTQNQQDQLNHMLDNDFQVFVRLKKAMTPKIYLVRKGDTLWRIAKKYLKDPFKWPLLVRQEDNSRISDPDQIAPGMKLRIYPYIIAKENKDALGFSSSYKEKSYQPLDYDKIYPDTRWKDNLSVWER